MICFCGKTALYRALTQGFCKEHREHAVKGMTYVQYQRNNRTIGLDQQRADSDAVLKERVRRDKLNKRRKPKNRTL
jgi:hypothetical protein